MPIQNDITYLGKVVSETNRLPVATSGDDPIRGKTIVGTARERFFDNFSFFDTTDLWEIVQTAAGATLDAPIGGAAAGSSPYLRIVSGTENNGKTILRSRDIFTLPLDLRFKISCDNRIATNTLWIGFLEVDPVTGELIQQTNISNVPQVLNARNAVMLEWFGLTATTANLRVRAGGSALDTLAAAYGAGYTTIATGTTPNFIPTNIFGLSIERDKIMTRAYAQNALTNAGVQVSYDKLLVNPNRSYKLYIIVENIGVPTANVQWRIHEINTMDATRFDISHRNAGTTDISKAFPVNLLSGTLTTLSTVTSSGTPAAPATPYILNSAATTNFNLVLTGSSGLHAFYASNTGATAAFVKLYNKATAPTSSDVPAMIIPVPAAVSGVPGVATLPIGHQGFRFALGLGIGITGGAADNDTTAVAANQVKVMLSRTV